MGRAENASRLKKAKQSRVRRVRHNSIVKPRVAGSDCANLHSEKLGRGEMSNDAIDPKALDELAATVGLSMEQANRTKIAALLLSTRSRVMRRAIALPAESPPSPVFGDQ
jgi:hypothetical protein